MTAMTHVMVHLPGGASTQVGVLFREVERSVAGVSGLRVRGQVDGNRSPRLHVKLALRIAAI